MTRFLRLFTVTIVIAALLGAMQLVRSGGSVRADNAGPTFNGLTPAPFATVAPGSVLIGANANGSAALTDVTLQLDGQQIAQNGSQSATSLAVSQQRTLSAGTHTAEVEATDANGNQFRAEWDFVVSSNAGDGEWFTAAGTPNADQINATIKSLVEAFRWHLYGLSWDGANHPDLPSHVGLTGTGAPLTPWVNGTTFDQANTTATLKSLVEAFRWHFWGISWDGQAHCDVPTHADCHQPQPPQSIDPWFNASGQPIPANITATLRSLVESFRWHFWGYSWDGSPHSDIPTHGTFHVEVTPTPTPSPTGTPTETPPTEGNYVFSSKLDTTSGINVAGDAAWLTTQNGFSLKLAPGTEGGATVNDMQIGDASYSVNVRNLTSSGDALGCLLLRAPQFGAGGDLYAFCLIYSGNSIDGAFAALASTANGSSITLEDDLADFDFNPVLDGSKQHQMKVIAEGDQFWFYVDDDYLGTVQDDSGPSSGTAGFWGFDVDDTASQTLQFSYLAVRALAP